MFEGKESNTYEERQFPRHGIYGNVDDFQHQSSKDDRQSKRRLFVRKETRNDFQSKPEKQHDELAKSIHDMYTTGTIYENTQSHPHSEKQLLELRDSKDKSMHVISDHANLKTVNELPLTMDPNWRASLSRKTVQNTQKVFKTQKNKSKNSNRGSKYSKESIQRLKLSFSMQQQQTVSRIIEAQQKSQEDMSKKFEN